MQSVKRWPTSCAVYVPNDGQEPGRKGSRMRGERRRSSLRMATERGNRCGGVESDGLALALKRLWRSNRSMWSRVGA